MNIKIKLLEAMTANGGHIQPGEIIELPELSAKAAIKEGIAERVDQEENSQTIEEQNTKPPVEDDEIAKLKKAIDDKYNKEPLAEAVKALGVEFPFDAKKADIIEAVIAAGKGAILLQ